MKGMDSLNWNHIRTQASHWCSYFGIKRISISFISLLSAAFVVWWLVHPSGPSLESVVPRASGVSDVLPSSSLAPLTVKVHVAGAVKDPGVYELPASARVIDAVLAAGGSVSSADLENINLAQTIMDTEQIYVPSKATRRTRITVAPRLKPHTSTTVVPRTDSASHTSDTSGSATRKVNINTASASELDVLPGVGPSTAQAIVTYRNKKGPFSKVEDLLNVPGIGPAKLATMRDQVTL